MAVTFIGLKPIIISLLKAGGKSYLSFGRLQAFLSFLWNELRRQHEQENYNILFDIDLGAIERTVRYNEEIFGMDVDAEIIYLRDPRTINLLARRYQVDKTILSIISNFLSGNT